MSGSSAKRHCPKCQIETERYKNGTCRICAAAQSQAWSAKNKEKRVKYSQKYAAANPEKIQANTAAYYTRNRETILAKSREYVAANPEKFAAKRSAYANGNKEKIKELWRASRLRAKEKRNEHSRKYRKENPERGRVYSHTRRARKRAVGGRFSAGIVDLLFRLQRGKCACCGLPLGNDFHLDHRTPLSRGGANDDRNVQLLRSLCNLQKHARDPIEFMQSRGFLL